MLPTLPNRPTVSMKQANALSNQTRFQCPGSGAGVVTDESFISFCIKNSKICVIEKCHLYQHKHQKAYKLHQVHLKYTEKSDEIKQPNKSVNNIIR